MGMHELQCKPKEVEGGAKDYMRLIRPFFIGSLCDLRFVLNMDQMPVFFLMNSKRTLEFIGKKTIHIHIRTSTYDTKQATVAVTIAGDGTILPSVMVFKGKANGRIARRSSQCSLHPITTTVRMLHEIK